MDFRDQVSAPLFPTLGLPLTEIENQKVLLLVGANIHKEQPIIGLKCRKMTILGGKVLAINTTRCPYHFDVHSRKVMPKGDLLLGLASVAKAVVNQSRGKVPVGAEGWLAAITPDAQDIDMAMVLLSAKNVKSNVAILVGFEANSHPEASRIRALCTLIALLTGATVGALTDGANGAGGWLTGFVPHRLPCSQTWETGLDVSEMLEKKLKAYCLLGAEPDVDCLESAKAVSALSNADFVCAITPYESRFLQSV